MLLLGHSSTLGALALALATFASARPQSTAVWTADSAIARKQGNGLDANGVKTVNYEHGELQWGLRLLYERTGNKTYFDYIVAAAKNIVDANGNIDSSYKYASNLLL